MRRRQFIAALGGAAAAWPLAVRAQQAMPVVGFLSSRSFDDTAYLLDVFRKGLGESGFVEGQNFSFAFRWADGDYARLPVFANELVAARVAVIVAGGGPPSALAAKAATTTIPIVFTAASDPVRIGLVPSLNRPSGNVTGMSTFSLPLAAKGIELLKEMIPAAANFAFLANPKNPSAALMLHDAQMMATALGVKLRAQNASTEDQLVSAFSELSNQRIDALVVAGEPFFDSQREKVVTLATQHRIPTCYGWRENVLLGGLVSYGNSLAGLYRQAALYTARVLKGEKPAELPVILPTKFELVLNLKTAKSLGLNISPILLARADEVIE